MREKILIGFLIIFLLILGRQVHSTKETDRISLKKKLWNIEQSYLNNYSKKDLRALNYFYHKKFVGWPE